MKKTIITLCVLPLLMAVLLSCNTTKKSYYEYIFFIYEFPRDIPIAYQTILQYKNGNKVKQINYQGEINHGWRAIPGHYPDTTLVGYSKQGDYGYKRHTPFFRMEYSKDTVTQCFYFTYPILINNVPKNPPNINLLEAPDFLSLDSLKLINQGQDTVFNGILSVKKYNRYLLVNDFFIDSIVLDIERIMLIKFFRKSSLLTSGDHRYEIVRVKEITEQYFNELWNKAIEENEMWDRAGNVLRCSPW